MTIATCTQHLWIMRDNRKSIYCCNCQLEKEIHEGKPLEESEET